MSIIKNIKEKLAGQDKLNFVTKIFADRLNKYTAVVSEADKLLDQLKNHINSLSETDPNLPMLKEKQTLLEGSFKTMDAHSRLFKSLQDNFASKFETLVKVNNKLITSPTPTRIFKNVTQRIEATFVKTENLNSMQLQAKADKNNAKEGKSNYILNLKIEKAQAEIQYKDGLKDYQKNVGNFREIQKDVTEILTSSQKNTFNPPRQR